MIESVWRVADAMGMQYSSTAQDIMRGWFNAVDVHLRHLTVQKAGDVRATLRECIAEGAGILAKGHLLDDDVSRWSHLNKRFHDTLVNSHESRVIADAIARNNHLPFASADSIALDRNALPAEYQKLRVAQMQHQLVFDALERRESARVEMLMREHAWVGFRYGQLFGLPGGPLGGTAV